MEEVVGSSPRGGRNFSHGKLSKIDPLVLKSHLENYKLFPGYIMHISISLIWIILKFYLTKQK